MNIKDNLMKKQDLDQLLEKYYKGESTEQDESILSAFFNSNDVPDGYEAEKAIFGFYRSAADMPEPSSDFEKRIIESINETEKRIIFKKLSSTIFPLLSAAAAILILAGTWFFFIHQKDIKDTFTDPHVAYNETLKILYNVSNQLNLAERALEPVSEMTALPVKSLDPLSKSRKILGKSLEDLGSLHIEIENKNLPDKENNNNK
jgi:hypothetical protein